jgi:hypothetical protein
MPGEVFVVVGMDSQAAVEDADEPVREGSEGLVVSGSAGAVGHRRRGRPEGIVERGEGL